jgi:hypothetical protein
MTEILATWEAEIRKIMFQSQTRKIVCEISIFKITRAKCTRGVTQAMEQLLYKHNALSSNPSSTPAKKILRSAPKLTHVAIGKSLPLLTLPCRFTIRLLRTGQVVSH